MEEKRNEKTNQSIFEQAIENECIAAYIYESMALLFKDTPGLYEFWDDLVCDEITHARILLDVRGLLTCEQLAARCDTGIWENVAKIRRLLRRDMVGTVQTLNDAFELAHELENSEVNAVFQILAIEFVPSTERRKFVLSEIKRHQKKLSDFNGSFGNKSWRQTIYAHRDSSD